MSKDNEVDAEPCGLNRRTFLTGAAAAAGALSALSHSAFGVAATTVSPTPTLLHPNRLQPDDLVGLANPATARHEVTPTEIMAEAIEALGLRTVRASNYYARWGNLAGSDEQRVADLHELFANPEVTGLWITGGWGSARLLPKLDYDLLRANPKVVVGYSDATALLNGIHSQTGLVTFHGPFPIGKTTAAYQRSLLMDGQPQTYRNPRRIDDDKTVVTEQRIRTLTPGIARGRLVGGNLTVLSAIVGSAYLPDFDGAILFLEDVNEALYRVDRMLTQLKLAGILDRIAGFVFGHCTECGPGTRYGSLTLEEILRDHIEPLGIPAWMGAMVGHIDEQFTLPIGGEARMDASTGELEVAAAVV